MFRIFREYRFEAGHFLPLVASGHKCGRPHGHNYRFTVQVIGAANGQGWVIDFGLIDEEVNPLIAEVDHRMLNDVPGLENPTAELIARWLWMRLEARIPGLDEITVHETDRCGAVYRGDV